MLMSCRTSSYFSSIDIQNPLRQFLDPMHQVFLLQPERFDFPLVPERAELLETVDFPLDGCSLTFPPEPLQRTGTFEWGGRRVGRGCNARHELGVHRT